MFSHPESFVLVQDDEMVIQNIKNDTCQIHGVF